MLLVMAESVAMRMREIGMKCTLVEVSDRDLDSRKGSGMVFLSAEGTL